MLNLETAEGQRPKVLCVDDEAVVVKVLSLQLKRYYDVDTATNGATGLEILARQRDVAVIISDMRMPGMDGATFLSRSREFAPHAVRLLLSGETDMQSAIAAVNQGQIFRFLTKPCPPGTLVGAVAAAIEQHRLVNAERVLLEQTLHGCIKTVIDVLSLADPIAFGRAFRIKQLVSDLAEQLNMPERWQVEMAAMLSQIGSLSLPEVTREKVYYGQQLSSEEEEMMVRVPHVAEQLLRSIPRIEAVRGILAGYTKPFHRLDPSTHDTEKELVHRGAEILKAATDFDVLIARGNEPGTAVDILRGRQGRHEGAVLQALAAVCHTAKRPESVRELSLAALRVGMVFAEDVKMTTGTLLVARGSEVTAGFVERVRHFRPGTVVEPIRAIVRTDNM
jgi:CheY-like chemotaxis protein